MFADDIKVVYTLEKSKKDATYDCIHEDLESLRKWSQNQILTFNPSKCNYSYTGHDAIPRDISFCDTQLQRVNITRDLGIFYSLDLTFAPHIAHTTARCNRLTGQIHRNLDRIESKILLYKMLVLAIVDYCCLLFGNPQKKDRANLESIQRRFTKQLQGPLSTQTGTVVVTSHKTKFNLLL